jgi:uncharacterized cupredoxin-like copper-binding protein
MSEPTVRSTRGARARRWARVPLVLGIVLVVLGAATSGATPRGHPGVRVASNPIMPGGNVTTVNATVNMTDAPAFDPTNISATAGAALHLHLVNKGQLVHTFTLCTIPNYVFPANLTPIALDHFFSVNGSQVNVSLAGGAATDVNLSIADNAAGESYEFVSVEPYQFQAGMHGMLVVGGPPSGPGTVLQDNTTDSLRFLPDVLNASPAKYPVTIDVEVFNLGSTPHTWTLAAQPNYTLSASNFTTYFGTHPPAVSVNVPTAPGTAVWANFTIRAPGIYEYICEIPGHFAGGMMGQLYVGVAPPAPAIPPSTAIVQGGVLVGAGALLVIGAVFVFAATVSGRSPPRTSAQPPHA